MPWTPRRFRPRPRLAHAVRAWRVCSRSFLPVNRSDHTPAVEVRPSRRLAVARRLRAARGQAAVEFVVLLPSIALLLAVAFQALLAGQAAWEARVAARAAARAHAAGGDATAAARGHLRARLEPGLRVKAETSGDVAHLGPHPARRAGTVPRPRLGDLALPAPGRMTGASQSSAAAGISGGPDGDSGELATGRRDASSARSLELIGAVPAAERARGRRRPRRRVASPSPVAFIGLVPAARRRVGRGAVRPDRPRSRSSASCR